MNDINIRLKQDDGSEIKCSTEHIEEDVLRIRCGLNVKKENGDAEIS